MINGISIANPYVGELSKKLVKLINIGNVSDNLDYLIDDFSRYYEEDHKDPRKDFYLYSVEGDLEKKNNFNLNCIYDNSGLIIINTIGEESVYGIMTTLTMDPQKLRDLFVNFLEIAIRKLKEFLVSNENL